MKLKELQKKGLKIHYEKLGPWVCVAKYPVIPGCIVTAKGYGKTKYQALQALCEDLSTGLVLNKEKIKEKITPNLIHIIQTLT